MRTHFLIVLSALVLSGNPIAGQTGSDFRELRTHYFNLDTAAGNRLLNRLIPVNGPDYLRAISYRDFLLNMLSQSRSGFELFTLQSRDRIQLLEKARPSTPGIQASIAEIHLYRAVLASQFSDYKSSATDLITAYRVVTRSGTEMAAPDRNKLSGILGILFGQIPEQHTRYLRLLGIRVSGLSGYNGLERYYTAAVPGSVERMEGFLLMVTALKEFDPDPAAAWNFVKSEGRPMMDNPLVRYQCAMAALRAGDCGSAITLLDIRTGDPVRTLFPYWNYQLGRCKLYREDDDAIVGLEAFLQAPGGDNFRHSAQLKAGWYHTLRGDPARAADCYSKVRLLPEPINTYDRQALNEANEQVVHDPSLLRARLLFDGGYYEGCLALCRESVLSGRYGDRDQGEFLYRQARCEQRLGRTSSAISSFLGVVQRASAIQSYLVPNAALQLGHLYKSSGQLDLARKYYHVCLETNRYGHREGIKRQAQLALTELE
jgi:tetratricopeptide (TPR) repeat protein